MESERNVLSISSMGERLQFTGVSNYLSRSSLDREVYFRWTVDGDSLSIDTDRFGYFPAFYANSTNCLSLSPSLLSCVKQSKNYEIDLEGLGLFLGFGFNLGNRTIFRNVYAAPPNWHVRTDQPIEPEYFLPNPPRCSSISRDEAIDTYLELFSKAVQKRIPQGDILVPLSAGQDSRHILLELHRLGAPIHSAVTLEYFPSSHKDETATAKEICRQLDIPHRVVRQKQAEFSRRRETIYRTEFSSDEHYWYLEICDFLEGQRSTVFDGIAGDVLSAGLFLSEENCKLYADGSFATLARRIFDPAPINYLKPSFRKGFETERLYELIELELRRFADWPNPLGAFYFWNRTRREIALSPYLLLPPSVSVQTPYIDSNLYDFLSSLPWQMLLDHTFHTDAIARLNSQISKIPYNPERRSLTKRAPHLRQLGVQCALDVLKLPANLYLSKTRHFMRLCKAIIAPNAVADSHPLTFLHLFLSELSKLQKGRE